MCVGDVGVACKTKGRRFIGFETDKDNLLLSMKQLKIVEMKLLDKIISDMHLSMKSGDRIKADTLRTLIAKLRDQEIKSRKKLG